MKRKGSIISHQAQQHTVTLQEKRSHFQIVLIPHLVVTYAFLLGEKARRRVNGRERGGEESDGEVDLKSSTPCATTPKHSIPARPYSYYSSAMTPRPVLLRRLWTQTIRLTAPRRPRPPSSLFSHSFSASSSANNSTCPQCGAAFACGCISLDCNACWCASLPLALSLPPLPPPPSPSSSPSDESEPAVLLSCLCPQCLKAKIDEAAKAREEIQSREGSKT